MCWSVWARERGACDGETKQKARKFKKKRLSADAFDLERLLTIPPALPTSLPYQITGVQGAVSPRTVFEKRH